MVIKRVAAITMVGAGLAASGFLLSQGWSGASPTLATGTGTGDPVSAGPTAGETATCSFWSLPTLEVAAVPQSELVEGVPYVEVCVDDAGEETAFVFVYDRDAAR
jgi:hypothetical protein